MYDCTSDKTTFLFGKRTAAISEFYFRFRFWPICSYWHAIFHQPAKFYLNRSAVNSWRHIDFSRWRPQSRKSTSSTSGFDFSDGTCMGRWKSTCIPHFDEISADIFSLSWHNTTSTLKFHFRF